VTRFVIRSQLWSFRRNETKRSCSARGFASVIRVIDAVHDWNLKEIEWAYPVQTSHVHGMKVRVGSPLVMRVDTAAGAKEVQRDSRMEAVAGERILAR
jgi:hypothetical protein